MSGFRFEPELFAHRNEAMDALSAAGFEWFTHYSSMDILHSIFGLEVCGVSSDEKGLEIEEILHRTFREWKYSHLGYKDGERDPGWKVVIHRDPEDGPQRSIAQ
jgi:hypothetical protein